MERARVDSHDEGRALGSPSVLDFVVAHAAPGTVFLMTVVRSGGYCSNEAALCCAVGPATGPVSSRAAALPPHPGLGVLTLSPGASGAPGANQGRT